MMRVRSFKVADNGWVLALLPLHELINNTKI